MNIPATYRLVFEWRRGSPVETEMVEVTMDGQPARALMIEAPHAILTIDTADPATVSAKLVFLDVKTPDTSGAEIKLDGRELLLSISLAAANFDDLQRRMQQETAAEIAVTLVNDPEEDRVRFDEFKFRPLRHLES